jgi:hypothetical protein
MGDKAKRLVAASLIEEFVSCRLTNFQFTERYPHSEDRALHAIHSMLWFAYDDLSEHQLEGKHALTDEARDVFQRCSLYLRSDLEYGGPGSFVSLTAPFKRVWNRMGGKSEEQEGLSPVWPFASLEQLEQARRVNSKM